MASREGLDRTDTDTALFTDPKVLRMWRDLRDSGQMATAMTLYEATRLASARDASRVTAQDAAPLWMSGVQEAEDALIRVGLLDAEGRIPDKAYESWIGDHIREREGMRESWRERKARSRAKMQDTAPVHSPSTVTVDKVTRDRKPKDAPPLSHSPTLPPPQPSRQTPGDVTVTGEWDVIQTYYGLSASIPTPKMLRWLNEMAQEHGEEQTCRALIEEHGVSSELRTILSRTAVRLASTARREEQTSRRDRASAAAKARRDEEDRIAASLTDEQRKANVERLRSMLAGSVLSPEEAARAVPGEKA